MREARCKDCAQDQRPGHVHGSLCKGSCRERDGNGGRGERLGNGARLTVFVG